MFPTALIASIESLKRDVENRSDPPRVDAEGQTP
jgi:hypothetical protein